ncbi:unnamed protein product [Lathyrus oleraceus]
MRFTVNFPYGGNFVRDYVIYYLGGHEHIVDIDSDKWSFFETTYIVKYLSQIEHLEYWLKWYKNDSDKYNRMVSDSDANEVYKYDVEMKCVVDIYVKYKVKGNVGVNFVEDEVIDDDVVNVEEYAVDDDGDNVGVNVKKEYGVNDDKCVVNDEYPNKIMTQTSYCCIKYGINGHNAKSCTGLVVDLNAQKKSYFITSIL